MSMTQESARECWCPFARVPAWFAGTGRTPANRYDDRGSSLVPGTQCIASQCMAWRWDNWGVVKGAPVTEGYCGLAVAPR